MRPNIMPTEGFNAPGADVKNAWSHTSTLPYTFMAWCLVIHRNVFTFAKVQISVLNCTITGLGVSSQLLMLELRSFPFTTASRPALGPTPPPLLWVPGGSFPEGKSAGL